MNTGAGNKKYPVSYTHLDVYKRQSYDAGSWTNFAKGNGRLNNAVAYVSPEFAGFKLSAMYSNGTNEDGAKWSDNIHYYGIGAQYTLSLIHI